MNSRERFEEWRDVKANFYWTNVTPEQAAESAWEEATRQALERAADNLELYCGEPEIAAYVRALMQQDKQEKSND
jgi:hypothetical protein